MALRTLRLSGDELLRKKSKPVREITDNIITLLDDMYETLRAENGVGLAAPQVGVLRRVVVVKLDDEHELVELINPEIVEADGVQEGLEACLSVPGKQGTVERPNSVRVRAQNRAGGEFTVEGEGFLARALCHELDHLDGVLYTDKAKEVHNVADDEKDKV